MRSTTHENSTFPIIVANENKSSTSISMPSGAEIALYRYKAMSEEPLAKHNINEPKEIKHAFFACGVTKNRQMIKFV